jgi:pilus assembly protein FimV
MASEHQSAAEGEEETSFISDFSPSDIDALQEETGEVDPAAEADVYIAYGRYQQAESLINQALEKSPNRLDLKSKLLEIYFTTRNVSAFTALAASLHDAGVPDSDPATWERVASMGSELAPSHDLFQGVEPSRSASRAGGEDEVDQDDLLTDSEALANLDLDLDTELSELPDEPMGGMSELMLPDEDSASTIEPPSKAIIQDESSGFDVGVGTAGEMSEFSLDLDDLDSLESVDLGHEDQGVEPDLGEPSGLSELGSEPLDMGFSETDSGRVGYEEDLPAISLDELDDAAMPSPEGGEGEPLSELLQEDDRSEEIETKLDLARAYIEMDDTEGASEILSEVLEEGDEAQKAAAREVLGQIG